MRKEFERVTPESAGIMSEDMEWLLDRLESGFTEPHGLMIMRHGKVCAEGWWSPYAPGIRHGLQSHSKTYAATAVGIAYTEGLVGLDERIIDIFPEEAPEHPSEYLKELTVHHVLCMGCGMDEMPGASKSWIRDFLHTPVVHKPGTTYMYNSVGSSLLAAIVVKKTGMGMHEYLKTRLYDKIGIFSDNHVWMKMPDGCEVGGGGLFATTEDNLRLMKLYADGGVWEGERILAEDFVQRATTLQNESASEESKNPPAKDNFVGYGYQIWMCRPKGVYRADGAMGQFTIVVPDMDMIIAITENAAGAHWAQSTLDTMWEFLDRIKAHAGHDVEEGSQMEGSQSERNQAEKSQEKNQVEKSQAERSPAAQRLAKRMKCLSLPGPAYAPYSPVTSQIQNREWLVREGTLYMGDVGMAHHMAGMELPDPVKSFSFEFCCDSVTMKWKTQKSDEKAVIAMDGSRRWNVLEGGAVVQGLMSGAWTAEHVLEVRTRFVETCRERVMTFTFEGEKVLVKEKVNMAFGEPTEQIIQAELSKEA